MLSQYSDGDQAILDVLGQCKKIQLDSNVKLEHNVTQENQVRADSQADFMLSTAAVKGVFQYVESPAPIWETSLESTKRVERQDELAQHLAHSCLIAQSFDSIGLNKICYTRLT